MLYQIERVTSDARSLYKPVERLVAQMAQVAAPDKKKYRQGFFWNFLRGWASSWPAVGVVILTVVILVAGPTLAHQAPTQCPAAGSNSALSATTTQGGDTIAAAAC
jgi:hypothetical protein